MYSYTVSVLTFSGASVSPFGFTILEKKKILEGD